MPVDPRTADKFGLAVFEPVASLTTYGHKLKWTSNIARATHNWPPMQEPSSETWTLGCGASLLAVDCVEGVSSSWSIWRLLWNHNGADIDQARVELFSCSDWTASEIDVTFEMQNASEPYERGGKAALLCNIVGRLGLAGSDELDFAGKLLVLADGTTERLEDVKITRGNVEDFTISRWEDGWEIKRNP